ncbi:hypothetical protein MMC10_007444 [Thelotrema lepadinum]|nr:hypothetical protein [Thelotrema lepadinum]
MNTIRSTWIGWGALMVAGGGAYYVAKKQINSNRQAEFEAKMREKRLYASLEEREALAPPTSQKKTTSKSKYEPKGVYRSKKGDRLGTSSSSEAKSDS